MDIDWILNLEMIDFLISMIFFFFLVEKLREAGNLENNYSFVVIEIIKCSDIWKAEYVLYSSLISN